jgi:acetyltransferase
MGIFDVSSAVKFLQENGVPVYRFPENAAKAFGALYQYSKWLNRQEMAPYDLKQNKLCGRKIIETCLAEGKTYIGELEGTKLLECYGFNVLPTELAKTGEEAVQLAEGMGYPVVMKIVSPQIIHKSDAGGVKINIGDAETVRNAYDEIINSAKAYNADAQIDGILVQKMAPKGEEVILGATRYPKFGHLLMFGSGGVMVEVFKDVAFRLAPINRNNARFMVRGVKGYKLLNGFRGAARADIDTLDRMLVCLSDLVVDNPEIKELDINPLLVHPEGQGATVADCRFIIELEDGEAQ